MAKLTVPPGDKAHYEKASPAVLAAQPSDKRPTDGKPDQSWQVLRNHLEQRLVGLRNWRSSWWFQNWSNLAQYIEPRRSIWLTQSTGGTPTPNNMTRGQPINNSIVDPTGTYAVRVCTGGMVSGLASQARPWFQMVPGVKGVELDSAARAWFDDVEQRMYTVMAGSNFYESFSQEIEDDIVFGTAPVIIYEDEQDIIRCYNPVCGEYYLSSSSSNRVDGLYRMFVMTVAQIVDKFGVENCPPDIVSLWNGKGNEIDLERIVAHSIEPNFGIKQGDIGKVPGKFTWREVYWVWGAGGNFPLSFKGFMEQPFIASRWSTQSNDAYGRSVGMDVLPDIIQLQVETLRKAEAIEKMVRPPLLASMELKNQPSSILPGHVTYATNIGAGNGMRPIYTVNPEINAMMQDLAEIQDRIKRGFFVDLFQMISDTPNRERVTAYEIAQKLNEKLAIIGPVIEGLLNQSLKPRLQRVYAIMERKGMIPPKPDSLKDIPLTVDFVSTLALAQKAAATGGIERLAAYIGNLVAVWPRAKNLFNVEQSIRTMSDLLGNDQAILNSPEKVAEMEEAEAKALQAQTQSAVLNQTAETVRTGAEAGKVLSETDVGLGQNALAALFSG